MGHVDHGKTTLLDYLRKSSVAAQEAGGITQHIGAFSVAIPLPQGVSRLTFLDTPGHAAFSRIRERGAKVTDIVVLVVSADDGIMAQTIESIQYAQAAKVPIVVAINKCDRFPDRAARIKEDLLRHDIVCEDFGGDVQSVAVSGLTGLNVDKLLEALLLQGEMLELRADPSAPVEGTVIESRIKAGLGECATMLVHNGTLRLGALLVANDAVCRVRLLRDHAGNVLSEAPPSMPVEVAGWRSLPPVGAAVLQVASDTEANEAAEDFVRQREEADRRSKLPLLRERERLHDKMWEAKKIAMTKGSSLPHRSSLSYEEFVEDADKRLVLPVIVKSDVIGSQEAVATIVRGIASQKVRINVISSGVGPATETDIRNAKATKAHLLLFGLQTPRAMQRLAQKEGVILQEFDIIYRLADYLAEAMAALLPAEIREKPVGTAAVLQLFSYDSTAQVAGCRIDDGTIYRSRDRIGDTEKYAIQLRRGDAAIWTGRIQTMRHLKKEIASAGKGMECGVILENCQEDIRPGDKLVCIERASVKPSI